MKPKILYLDIETSNLWIRSWGIYDVNAGVNQIKKDWTILCWSAKWDHSFRVMSAAAWDSGEKACLEKLWLLMDRADIIITQNGKRFDKRKIFARMVRLRVHRRQPPSGFKHIDTRQEAKKHFGFTSNSLEYLADYLRAPYKKLAHKRFPGQELWNEVEKKNPAARREMVVYCKNDVLTLEAIYKIMRPWIMPVDFSKFHNDGELHCSCGSTDFIKYGFNSAREQRYKCITCGNSNLKRTKKGKPSKENGT